MARIRTIKPEFWSDEKLGSVPRDGRLLFAALFNLAEDHGVARGSAAYLRSQVFPYDEDMTAVVVSSLTAKLEAAGLIRRFGFDGQSFIFIVNFAKHQKIDRPSKTTLPPPPPTIEGSTNTRRVLDEGSLLEGKGEEGKGMEGKGAVSPPPSNLLPLGKTEPPTSAPQGWSALEFWSWAQSKRLKAGLPPERPTKHEKLSAWWSAARMLCGDVERLKQAFYSFGDDKHWQKATPPLPFQAFISQWEKYLPQEDVHA